MKIIYLEDPPIKPTKSGTGISKAFYDFISFLSKKSDYIYILCSHSKHDLSDIDVLSNNQLLAPKVITYFAKFYKLIPILGYLFALTHGIVIGYRLKKLNCRQVFTIVGTDFFQIIRLFGLVRATRCDLYIYFVDDIETHPSNLNFKLKQYFIKKVICCSKTIYTITDQLSNRFENKYGVKPYTLPILINTEPSSYSKKVKVIPSMYFGCFLGSINHLYFDGIIDLIKIIENIRIVHGDTNINFRIIAKKDSIKRLYPNFKIPEWVIINEITDDFLVESELSSSIFAFLPYSFDEKSKVMVNTSFPSKLITYLKSAKNIVVYSPEYSSTYKYFSENNLPYFCSSASELELIVNKLYKDFTNNSLNYFAILAKNHSTRNSPFIFEN